ncbi:RNA polymerase sigma factor RpoD/SigA [Vibrio sp.]|nr:RNA polymerase sigma factor RpoD/SigA [Vibrio sp.]
MDVTAQEKQEASSSVSIESLYMRELARYPLLKAKEEHAVAVEVKSGSKAARQKMINSNLRLVVNVAKKHLGRGLDFSDLVNEGNIGLIHAVEKFEPDLGYRFSTYAMWWIKQSIDRAIMNQARTIRIPVHKVKEIRQCYNAMTELRKEGVKDPTPELIAKKLGIETNKVAEMLRLNEDSISLNHSWGNSENEASELLQTIHDEDIFDHPENSMMTKNLHSALNSIVTELPEKHRNIINLRYGLNDGEPQTLGYVAEMLGISRERVRQIQNQTLNTLKDKLRKQSIDKESLAEV